MTPPVRASRRRLAPLALVAVAVAVAVLAAACGGDDDDGDGAAPSTETTMPTTSSTTGGEPPADPDDGPRLAEVSVRLADVADVESPTAMAVRPGDPALYVAERAGVVRVVHGGGAEDGGLLDISGDVSTGGERGLLGIAFSPDGGRFYVSYTNVDGDSRIDEYEVVDDGVLDEGSRRQVLAVDQPFSNHNGGNIIFGPDGYLWFGLGDGGSGGDPQGNGQDPSTLLGSLLRIDPLRGDPYAIPDDNPFADGDGGAPEVYVYGLRNPWRFSFDRETEDLWIADVGQNAIEEIDVLAPSDAAGANLGWNRLEGTRPFEGEAPPDAVPPVFEYDRDGGCSVTGGYVYRGRAIPPLRGAYLFADYCAGDVRALHLEDGRVVDERELGVGADELVSFGEDHDGELYVLSFGAGLQRLEPA